MAPEWGYPSALHVECMASRLWCGDNPPRGASFFLACPLRMRRMNDGCRTPTVFVIDDDAHVRAAVRASEVGGLRSESILFFGSHKSSWQ